MKWRLYNKISGVQYVGTDKDIIELYAEKTGLELKELDEWTAQEIAEELFGKHAKVKKVG
jgi:hypothetical protein